jgi:hypothetical protein
MAERWLAIHFMTEWAWRNNARSEVGGSNRFAEAEVGTLLTNEDQGLML